MSKVSRYMLKKKVFEGGLATLPAELADREGSNTEGESGSSSNVAHLPSSPCSQHQNTRPHMSLSIRAPTNPICTAMRDFVQTDYLALDNKRSGAECMCMPMQGEQTCSAQCSQEAARHQTQGRQTAPELRLQSELFPYRTSCCLSTAAV